MTNERTGRVLVLGIAGGIGGATAAALHRQGHAIRAMTRSEPKAKPAFPVDWRRGDALDAAAVLAASESCDLIVHGVNPPGYRRWREKAIPMLANTIAAAKASGATILFPGNVYVFAESSGTLVDETAPHMPTTRKGAVRRDMEAMLAEAARDGVRSITLRCGDFFGPGAESSWFTKAIAKGGWNARALADPTVGGAGHSWTYVPDAAEAFARLVAIRDRLPAHAVLHFAGHWLDPGTGMARAVEAALGRAVPIEPFPHWAVRLLSPVVPMFREVAEMAWLWRHPLRLDNRRLVALIGPEPHTPLDIAVSEALGPRSKPIDTPMANQQGATP